LGHGAFTQSQYFLQICPGRQLNQPEPDERSLQPELQSEKLAGGWAVAEPARARVKLNANPASILRMASPFKYLP
jgi:hypothetical protein